MTTTGDRDEWTLMDAADFTRPEPSQCPNCGDPITYHRSDQGTTKKITWTGDCTTCAVHVRVRGFDDDQMARVLAYPHDVGDVVWVRIVGPARGKENEGYMVGKGDYGEVVLVEDGPGVNTGTSLWARVIAVPGTCAIGVHESDHEGGSGDG